jgi:hypothetical protein
MKSRVLSDSGFFYYFHLKFKIIYNNLKVALLKHVNVMILMTRLII